MRRATFVNIMKIIIIAISYIIVIMAKLLCLYTTVRFRLAAKRVIYKWRFKSKLRKHKVPYDLKKQLEKVYSEHLNSSLRIPGLREGLRLIRKYGRSRSNNSTQSG